MAITNYVYRSDEGRWGCLTSGDRWDFYFLRKRVEQNADGEDVVVAYDLFELVDVKANGKNGMHEVMGTYYHQKSDLMHRHLDPYCWALSSLYFRCRKVGKAGWD